MHLPEEGVHSSILKGEPSWGARMVERSNSLCQIEVEVTPGSIQCFASFFLYCGMRRSRTDAIVTAKCEVGEMFEHVRGNTNNECGCPLPMTRERVQGSTLQVH